MLNQLLIVNVDNKWLSRFSKFLSGWYVYISGVRKNHSYEILDRNDIEEESAALEVSSKCNLLIDFQRKK